MMRVLKVAFLATQQAQRNGPSRSRIGSLPESLNIEFGDRLNGHLYWSGQLHRIIYRLSCVKYAHALWEPNESLGLRL